MRPLSRLHPKVLLPVAERPLLDHAVERLRTAVDDVAVNAHVDQGELRDHVAGLGATCSLEAEAGLGTAGALAVARDWVDGRDVLVVNGDTWCPGSLAGFVDGWDRERFRILVPGGGPMTPRSRVAAALLPWSAIAALDAVPSGIWEVCWSRDLSQVEPVAHDGAFVDCADAADYLRANLEAAGGSVIPAGCAVEGVVEDSVLWPGAVVRRGEVLRRAVRTSPGPGVPSRTVLIRR